MSIHKALYAIDKVIDGMNKGIKEKGQLIQEQVRIIKEIWTSSITGKGDDGRKNDTITEKRYGMKLAKFNADLTTLKLLRKLFPNRSISELQDKIHSRDYIFLSDMRETDSERYLAGLLWEFENAGIGIKLFVLERKKPLAFEKGNDISDAWQEKSINRDYLVGILQREREKALYELELLQRKLENAENTLKLLT